MPPFDDIVELLQAENEYMPFGDRDTGEMTDRYVYGCMSQLECEIPDQKDIDRFWERGMTKEPAALLMEIGEYVLRKWLWRFPKDCPEAGGLVDACRMMWDMGYCAGGFPRQGRIGSVMQLRPIPGTVPFKTSYWVDGRIHVLEYM